MTIAGYAIGAAEGILYLRGEYAYLRAYLEAVLARRPGQSARQERSAGAKDFDFDIRIQMGAGAYVCGEETALISSCEGCAAIRATARRSRRRRAISALPDDRQQRRDALLRDQDPREGPAPSTSYGNAPAERRHQAAERLRRLQEAGRLRAALRHHACATCSSWPAATDAAGGAGRRPERSDGLARTSSTAASASTTWPPGGSIIVFGPQRDLLEVALAFWSSSSTRAAATARRAAWATCCSRSASKRVSPGAASQADLEYAGELGETMKTTSRCGLGQTSPNPVLTR
jgi:[NiFe] hydrogenase diaphorase moiety large subunit